MKIDINKQVVLEELGNKEGLMASNMGGALLGGAATVGTAMALNDGNYMPFTAVPGIITGSFLGGSIYKTLNDPRLKQAQ